jgi:hypothetical protein
MRFNKLLRMDLENMLSYLALLSFLSILFYCVQTVFSFLSIVLYIF